MTDSNAAEICDDAAGAKRSEKPSTSAEVPKEEVTEAERAAADEGNGEYGGPKGPEPTRYGDWEKAGRCIDF